MELRINNLLFVLNIYFQMSYSLPISDLIIDYFIQKNIHIVNALVCNQSDAILIHKGFQRRNTPFLSIVHSVDFEYKNHLFNSIKNTVDTQSLGLFIDSNCETSTPLLQEIFLKIVNNCCYNILFWNKIQINKLLINRSTLLGTELVFADPIDNIIYLYSVEITNNSEPIFMKVGKWDNRLLLFKKGPHFEKKMNGNIIQGIISLTDQNTITDLVAEATNESMESLELSSLTNFALNIYGCLRRMYNFQWKVTNIYDTDILKNPKKFFNNSKNSLDFLITSENQVSTLFSDIRKLPSIKTIRQCFVFRHPPVYSYITFYLKPFSLEIWICLIIFLLASTVLLYLMCLFNFEDIDYNELSVFGNFLFCLGALINQGLTVSSVRNSKRIVHFNILQLSLFISNFYSAIILNYLLYPTRNIISSVDDILEEGFEIGIENTQYNKNTFSVNTSVIYRHNIQDLSGYYDIATGVEKLRKSKFAFLSIDSNIYMKTSEYFTGTEMCDISSVPLNNDNKISMYLKKNSPYKEIFQKGILLLKETGITSREDKIWNKKKLKCSDAVKYIEIGLAETLFSFKMYLFGFGFSVVILLLELIHYKMRFVILKNLRKSNRSFKNFKK